MDFNDLTDEQKAKAKDCRTPEDLVALAQEEGVELTDRQIEQISGGGVWNHPKSCPACGKGNIYHYASEYHCRDCGYTWTDGGW